MGYNDCESLIPVSIPILCSERGTRHDRTQGETQSNVGRDAIERGRAFAKKYRDWGFRNYFSVAEAFPNFQKCCANSGCALPFSNTLEDIKRQRGQQKKINAAEIATLCFLLSPLSFYALRLPSGGLLIRGQPPSTAAKIISRKSCGACWSRKRHPSRAFQRGVPEGRRPPRACCRRHQPRQCQSGCRLSVR